MISKQALKAGPRYVVFIVGGLHTASPWSGIESADRLQNHNVQIHRFTYSFTTALGGAPNLDNIVAQLHRYVLQAVAMEKEDNLVFIGHSLGGIIVQKLLIGPGRELVDRVRLVLLVGSPVSARPSFLSLLPNWLLHHYSLTSSSMEYDILNEAWDQLRKERGLRVASVVGLNDNVAPYNPGRHWDTRNIVVVNQGHVGLGRDTDTVSRVLCDQLEELSGATAS